MTVGHSDRDGFVTKDVKFGATPQFRAKYLNSKWVDLNENVGGRVNVAGSGAWTTIKCPALGDPNGLVKLTFDPGNGNNDGYPNVKITFEIAYTAAGLLTVTETSNWGDSDRWHMLGIDVDCSQNGSPDPSDDGLRFNHTTRLFNDPLLSGPAAQVRYESDMFGDGQPTNDADYEAVEPGLDNRLCFWENAEEAGVGLTTVGYALQCTACTADSASASQYNDDPWNYLNTQSTWEVDVMFAVQKSTIAAQSGNFNYVTKFEMTAVLF
jgi:hypothetical protein